MVQTLEDTPRTGTAAPRQHTLAEAVTMEGRGLLLGEPARLVMEPAPPGHGIVFERTDLDTPVRIPARIEYVAPRARRTTLLDGDVTIETVEHLMSAFAGLRIDNVLVRIDGPEVPCGDGSAAPFVETLLAVEHVEQDAPRRILRVTEPILVQDGDMMLAAFPSPDDDFQVVYDLDYGPGNAHRIKRQVQAFAPANGDYRAELASARTYSLREEALALQGEGMCRHLTPADVLVIGDDGPIDNEYRFDNEPVRHKIVDLLGDLNLVGGEVRARIVAYKSGHSQNHELCRRILEQGRMQRRERSVRRMRSMDIRAIKRLMPHRYPMLLVDRVLEIEGDRRAVGIKNVTINEPFFEGHYPQRPIMPGVLLVEAMAQLGGLLLSRTLEHSGRIAVLLSLDKVKLRRPVVPGDQLLLEAETTHATTRTASLACQAHVGHELVAQAQIRFMMVDADQD